MECSQCGEENATTLDQGTIRVSIWGHFCSDECQDAFHQRRQQRHAELRAEPLLQTPAVLTVSDFEAFALKVAVYASLSLDAVQELPEGLRDPDILALQVKEVLLRHLPDEYVSTWQEGSGWSRKSRYSFRKPVPRELLRAAMRDAGFEWRVAWFGNVADRVFLATELGVKLHAVRRHILRAIEEAEFGIQSTTAVRVDPAAFEPLMKYIKRLDEQWRLHHHIATEGLSNATDVSAREALERLDRLEHSFRVLALGPANAA